MKIIRLRRYTNGEKQPITGLRFEILKGNEQGEVVITRPQLKEKGRTKIEFLEPNLSFTSEEFRQLFVIAETGVQPLTGKQVYKDKESKEVIRREKIIEGLQKRITQLEQENVRLKAGKT